MLWTDAARLLIGTSIMTFGAWADLRWRRAPNHSWWIAGAAGLVLLAIDAILEMERVEASAAALAISAAIALMAIAFYWFGIMMGGADAKALAAFAILGALPLDPAGFDVPLASPFPLVLTMLGNALVFVPLIPVSFFVWNAAHGHFAVPTVFVGYKRAVAGLDDAHVWSLEWIDEDGEPQRTATPGRVPYEASRERVLAEHGLDEVWVTPKIPFLVPLAAGFVFAFFGGDVLAWVVSRLVGAA